MKKHESHIKKESATFLEKKDDTFWNFELGIVEEEEKEEEEVESPRSRPLIHQIIFAILFGFAHL